MKLRELVRDVVIQADNVKNWEQEVTALCSDSRKAVRGALFVCLNGTRENGHSYIQDAWIRGAELVLVETIPPFVFQNPDITYLQTENTHSALAHMWNLWYNNPTEQMQVVAVTGTNGKTSVTHLLRAIFEETGAITGIIGTIGCKIGNKSCLQEEEALHLMTTPDPEYLFRLLRDMADNGVSYVCIEASSHALALCKLDGMHIKCGIFTNLSCDHLDFHGTMEKYREAKTHLFQQCEIGILNADDKNTPAIAAQSHCETYFYSIHAENADYVAYHLQNHGINGISYDCYHLGQTFALSSPIPGNFTVYNTLAATACALRLGIEPCLIQKAVQKLQGICGRMERIPLDETKAHFSVFIDYAHTPDALENVLKTLRTLKTKQQPLTVIFGCGGNRDRTKRPLMGAIASKLADFVIVTSDNSRMEKPSAIIKEILKGMDKERPFAVIENRKEAIEYAIAAAATDEIILLAGKGQEDYEITADGKHPFSERQIVWDAIQKKECK